MSTQLQNLTAFPVEVPLNSGRTAYIPVYGTVIVDSADMGSKAMDMIDANLIAFASSGSSAVTDLVVPDSATRLSLNVPLGRVVRQQNNGVLYRRTSQPVNDGQGWEVIFGGSEGTSSGGVALSGGSFSSPLNRVTHAGEIHLRVFLQTPSGSNPYTLFSNEDGTNRTFDLSVTHLGAVTVNVAGKIVSTRAIPGIFGREFTLSVSWDSYDANTWVRVYIDGAYQRTYLVSGSMGTPVTPYGHFRLASTNVSSPTNQVSGNIKHFAFYPDLAASNDAFDRRAAGLSGATGGVVPLAVRVTSPAEVPSSIQDWAGSYTDGGNTCTISGTHTLTGGATSCGVSFDVRGLVRNASSTDTVRVELTDLSGTPIAGFVAVYATGLTSSGAGSAPAVGTGMTFEAPAYSSGQPLLYVVVTLTPSTAYTLTFSKPLVYLKTLAMVLVRAEDWTIDLRGIDATVSGADFVGTGAISTVHPRRVVRSVPASVASATIPPEVSAATLVAITSTGVDAARVSTLTTSVLTRFQFKDNTLYSTYFQVLVSGPVLTGTAQAQIPLVNTDSVSVTTPVLPGLLEISYNGNIGW